MSTHSLQSGLLRQATRHLFFTGKGGVGKTSLACATAIALADEGKRVLLVSTDPASNLDEVLETVLSGEPTAIASVPGLWAANLDPEEAARTYRERVVGPYRGIFPEATIANMEEQLSGACTVEIAAFDEFTQLLADPRRSAGYDHVIFDTAPTGHTLRLLSLPSAWTGFIESNMTGTSCLGPLAGLQKQQALYEASAKGLRDPELTTLVLVTRPESASLAEAERSRAELAELGVTNQHVIVNGFFEASDSADDVAAAMADRMRRALAEMPEGLSALPRTTVPLRAVNMVGVPALRSLLSGQNGPIPQDSPDHAAAVPNQSDLLALVDELAECGHGVVMTMGKGGVGKTTVAAALARELARRGHRVHLSTTDPAAHVEAAVGQPSAGMTVGRIDPAEETRRYVEETMARSEGLDENGKALLEEDLRSPCTEEIAVFNAFAKTVAKGQDGFVVLDTAPTGHTLLLLDASESYHREVARTGSDVAPEVRELLPRLRDPQYTHVFVVTLPEPTPVHEAEQLQADLRRAGITPFAWVVNRSLSHSGTRDPLLSARARTEGRYIGEVEKLSSRFSVLPWSSVEPIGEAGLAALLRGRKGEAPVAVS